MHVTELSFTLSSRFSHIWHANNRFTFQVQFFNVKVSLTGAVQFCLRFLIALVALMMINSWKYGNEGRGMVA